MSTTLAEEIGARRPRLSPWQAAALYARQIAVLVMFFGTGLIVSPVCWLLHWLFGNHIPASKGQELIARLFGNWLRRAQHLGIFEISFPEQSKLAYLEGTVIAPNHPTLIDAVIMLSVLPHTACIMRADLMRNPFLAGAALMAGYVSNDQGPSLIRQGMEKIREGNNLLIFPEGTRTRKEPVNAFKKGFALLSTKTDAPIQTVFIERYGRFLSKGVPPHARSFLPLRVRIHLGKVFHPEPGESAQALSARLETYYREHLENDGTNIRLTRSQTT